MPESWEKALSYGEAVRAVLVEHGLSFRAQRARTGLPHSTVAGWVNDGIPPSEEKARDFARGFNLPEDRWLEKAGHHVASTPQEGLKRALEGADQLEYDPDFEDFNILNFDGSLAAKLSPEGVEQISRLMKAAMSEERRLRGLD